MFGDKPATDSPAKGDIIVSKSQIDSYKLCPAKLRYRDDRVGLWGRAAVRGITLHQLIEERLEGASRREINNPAHIRSIMEGIVAGGGHTLSSLSTQRKIDNTIESIQKMMRSWLSWYAKADIRIVAIEEQYTMPIGTDEGRGVWLTGIVDAIADDGTIWDWKSASRAWSYGKPGSTIQAPLYTALARDAGHTVDQFSFLVITPDALRTVHTVVPSDRQILAALDDAYMVGVARLHGALPHTPWPQVGKWNRIEKREEVSRGWHCSPRYCDSWDACTGKFLDPTVDERTRIEPTW